MSGTLQTTTIRVLLPISCSRDFTRTRSNLQRFLSAHSVVLKTIICISYFGSIAPLAPIWSYSAWFPRYRCTTASAHHSHHIATYLKPLVTRISMTSVQIRSSTSASLCKIKTWSFNVLPAIASTQTSCTSCEHASCTLCYLETDWRSAVSFRLLS